MNAAELEQLARLLAALGCPPEKTPEMAAQLDKRAAQLAEAKSRTHAEALAHLIELFRQAQQNKS